MPSYLWPRAAVCTMSAKASLKQIAARFIAKADEYRESANTLDRNACRLVIASQCSDADAEKYLAEVMLEIPEWFPS